MRLQPIRVATVAAFFLAALVVLARIGITASLPKEVAEASSARKGVVAEQRDSPDIKARDVVSSERRGRLAADNG